jgi:hypothetical protein
VVKKKMTVKVLGQLVGGDPPEAADVNFMCPEELATYNLLVDSDILMDDNERKEKDNAVDEFLKKEGLL